MVHICTVNALLSGTSLKWKPVFGGKFSGPVKKVGTPYKITILRENPHVGMKCSPRCSSQHVDFHLFLIDADIVFR